MIGCDFNYIVPLRRTDLQIRFNNFQNCEGLILINFVSFIYRLGTLLEEIGNANEEGGKIIIFVETKKKVENITKNIRRYGWPAVCMHGDKSQQERDYVLRGKQVLETFIYRSSNFLLGPQLNYHIFIF